MESNKRIAQECVGDLFVSLFSPEELEQLTPADKRFIVQCYGWVESDLQLQSVPLEDYFDAEFQDDLPRSSEVSTLFPCQGLIYNEVNLNPLACYEKIYTS